MADLRAPGGSMLLTNEEVQSAIRELLKKYHGEYALLFGSYARGEATPASDLDVVVFEDMKPFKCSKPLISRN